MVNCEGITSEVKNIKVPFSLDSTLLKSLTKLGSQLICECTLMKIMSKPETVKYFDDAYNNMTIRYGDLKKQLADDIVTFVAPLRDRINELSHNDEYISKVAREGAEKARANAQKTIKEVREIIGFKHF